MKDRVFRTCAVVLGVLGIPSLALQIVKSWPPGHFELQFFGLQAAVLGAFLIYGLSVAWPRTPNVASESSEEIDSNKECERFERRSTENRRTPAVE